MRQLTLICIAVALLAVFSAAALLPTASTNPPLPTWSSNPAPMPTHSWNDGGLYFLMRRLMDAAMKRDVKAIEDIIADDAIIKISDVHCGWMNKTQFVDIFKNDQVASEIILIRDWIESYGNGIFQMEFGGLFNGAQSNFSLYNPHVIVSAGANEDGTKLNRFEQYTDRTWAQANASSMMATFYELTNASKTLNIAPWNQYLTADSEFHMWEPFSKDKPFIANKTSFIADLTNTYARLDKEMLIVTTAFPVCQIVASSMMVYHWNKDGTKKVNKIFLGMQLDTNFNVNIIDEFPLFSWNK